MSPHPLLLLVVEPFLFSALIFLSRWTPRLRRVFFLAAALCHITLTVSTIYLARQSPLTDGVFALDPLSSVILGITSVLFLCVGCVSSRWVDVAYKLEGHGRPNEFERETVFFGCLTAFLGSMTAVLLAQNFGVLWVAVEATTLLSAPLIGFHRGARSIEALWKYMLICSVGIGFALFGTMLMAHACQIGTGSSAGLSFAALAAVADKLDPAWFKAAFIFILAGYGTKMGLAPFHTWLPDAHSEAPAIVSALLSGALLNCSFLGIYRFRQIAPASVAKFCDTLMIALGLFSLITAAIFIIRQRDFKRMLAYSSVEHMGLIILMLGLGMKTILPLHIAGHSLIKMSLFLVAGNILFLYGTREVSRVNGLLARSPWVATLWAMGILFICGAPPSPLFFTELKLVAGAGPWLGGAILLLLFVIFAGMTHALVKMAFSAGSSATVPPALTDTPHTPITLPAQLSWMPTVGFLLAMVVGLCAFMLLLKDGIA